MRVLLINPAESDPAWPTMPRAVEPMGLLYVAGAFRSVNVEVDLVDLQLGHGNQDRAYRRVARRDYDGAGIALASQNCLWNALSIAHDLKGLCSDLPVFTGGVFASLNSGWILSKSPAVDFVVVGEGESFAVEWTDRKGKWQGIPGIDLHDPGSPKPVLPAKTFSGPEAMPDRSMTQAVIDRGDLPSVVASRGCGGNCSFCCIVPYYGSHWQPRPLQAVRIELSDLSKRFGVRRLHFVDDNLFGHTRKSRSWIESFLVELARINPPLRFKTTCRLDDLDEALVPRIKQAGFDLLKIGIETFSPETQRVYRKPISRDEAARKLDLLASAGIDVSLGFIMFDPYCSVADLRENLDFLLTYRNNWSRHLLRSSLTAYRGTRIERRLKRDGLTASESIMGTTWRFRDAAVRRIQERFEKLLQTHQLDLEQKMYDYARSRMRVGCGLPLSREPESLLKECWIDLFKSAIEERDPPPQCTRRLGRLSEWFAANFKKGVNEAVR